MKNYRTSGIFQIMILLTVAGIFLSGCFRTRWTVLFNGENLEGWSVKCLPEDGGKDYWKVESGYIECNTLGDTGHNYVWLVTEQEFDDFHLKLKFQVFRASPGNSGVQFRSRYDDSESALNGGWMNGPQADIHGPLPERTGLVYDETEEARRWIHPSLPDWNMTMDQLPPSARLTELVYAEDDPEAWNTLEIICNGMLVQTVVNGNLVADFRGEGILDDAPHVERGVGNRGCVALQLHEKDELRIRFKEILVREL